MGGYGHRWMYYATGLPGWMRFGFSPGWLGRSPTGLGPCAEYLLTGRWPTPQMAAAWGAGAGYPGAWPTAPGFFGAPAPGTMTPEQELSMLRSQAEALKGQLDQIAKRIEELEKK
ncbi:MAG TPA: hypothetical protein ENF84_02360 [Chloroflexi bacterium]|nr:hypothetical protein [Chloroflexota bacterium]